MVPHQVEPRRGHQRGQPLQQLHRLEQHVGGAVAPAMAQAVDQPPLGAPLQPIRGQGRSGHVAAQAFQPGPVAGRNGDVGVDAEAGGFGASRVGLRRLREQVRVDAIAEAQDALPPAGSGGDAAPHRGGVQRGQQRLLEAQRVGPVGIGLGAQPAALEQAAHRSGDAPRDAGHLAVVRRRHGAEAHRVARVEDAVERQRVEVDVQVQGVAEALDEGDRARAESCRASPAPPGAAAHRPGDRADEGAQHVGRQRGVVRQAVTQRHGQRQHPLAHGHPGQHAIDEVRGGVGHAPSAAGRAERRGPCS